MVKALKARGVNVEYMVGDNEGHGFHNDENKFEFYEAMEKFLLQHLAVVAFDPAGLAATAALAALPRPAPSSPRSRPRRNRPSRRFPPGRGPVPGAVQRHVGARQDAVRRIAAPVAAKPPLTVILISPSTVCSGASRSASHTRCACTSALAGSQSYISNANFAAQAAEAVAGAHRALHHPRKMSQRLVAGGVTMAVIDRLEEISPATAPPAGCVACSQRLSSCCSSSMKLRRE